MKSNNPIYEIVNVAQYVFASVQSNESFSVYRIWPKRIDYACPSRFQNLDVVEKSPRAR
jgi:hypothetical protein